MTRTPRTLPTGSWSTPWIDQPARCAPGPIFVRQNPKKQKIMPPQNTIKKLHVRVQFIDSAGQVRRTDKFDLTDDRDRKDMGRACADWYTTAGRKIISEVIEIVKA